MTGKYRMLQKLHKAQKNGFAVVISLPTISEEKRKKRILCLFSFTQSTLHLADASMCFG